MAKKKDKPQVINNIQELNLEIDYDKLAEAIVKANNKQQELYSPSREWMKYILTPIFLGVAFLSGVLGIASFISLFQDVSNFSDNVTLTEITAFLLKFVMSLFAVGFCVFSIVAKKEIEKENDKTYVATIFSNIIALVALVISAIALFKGVG